jgi:hypothetical protein
MQEKQLLREHPEEEATQLQPVRLEIAITTCAGSEG